ncbi:MAG: (2Fe-2S)-binding protein [Betaproteobacteria bacterium]|nr:(2Fe-2S)-binding protein [Betaproteobacteria bacterium]
MYVCICNAVTESDIGSAVAEGCCSLRQLSEQLGVGACCGRCKGCARDVLKNSLHAHTPLRPAAAGQLAAA